jgi:putative copper export protein/mono/diheme cytochrome c family protein/peroxiredoxin
MTGLAIVIRVIHLGASLVLVGTFSFLVLVVRPATRTEKSENQSAFEHFDRLLLQLAGWSLAIVLTSGLLGLWVQLATVTNRPLFQALTREGFWKLLTGTQYGRVWLIRTTLMLLLGGFLWLRDQEQDGKDWWALRLEGVGLAVSLLMALAWTGHTATAEGISLVVQVAADALHLLAGGVWLGSLPLLILLLSWARRADDPSADMIAAEATRRFSALGLACVSLLILTGLANAWELVGTIPALVGTSYGRLLLLKLSLLLLLLVPAATNLLRERPRLLQSVTQQAHMQARQTIRQVRGAALVEAALGGLILLLVGGLGIMPPAIHDEPIWPFSFRLSWEATKDLPGVRSQTAIGIQLSMLGGLAMLLALMTRIRHWPWIVGAGLATIVVGFVVWLPKLAVDAYPTTYVRPAAPYNAFSIANGLDLYRAHCAVCHGAMGYGDGPAAAGLRPRPADLTAKHTADHTAGDIFWWLTYGRPGTTMPGFQERLSVEARWDLINFVRTLSAAERARLLGPLVGSNLWLVAPDFTYTTALGVTRNLKDHRGRDLVLLVFFTLPNSRGRLVQLHELYPRVRLRGMEILAIPLQSDETIDERLDHLSLAFPIVLDGAIEASTTYTLLRRSLSSEGSLVELPVPSHLEFLVDRQGYVRGRWLPGEGDGWGDIEQLVNAIDSLNSEKLDTPPPALHVH